MVRSMKDQPLYMAVPEPETVLDTVHPLGGDNVDVVPPESPSLVLENDS